MIIDTDNYDAQTLQMFFDSLTNLHTKQRYKEAVGISPEGVKKRLKSIYSPQTYKLGGVLFIECEVVPKVEIEKLVLKKNIKPF